MNRLPAHRLIPAFCLAAITLFISSPARAATPDQVNAAIDKGVEYLFAHQTHGNWEEVPAPDDDEENSPDGGQYGGLTAIATYALLCADLHEHDPRIAPAITFLEKMPPHGVYTAAIRCMIWSRINLDAPARAAANRDFMYLRGAMHRTGKTAGTFSYEPGPSSFGDDLPYDNSVSQFAVLGLWSLYYEGFNISQEDWKIMDTAWRAHQYVDGSWPYYDGSGWDMHLTSTTAAGIATLFITDQSLHSGVDCMPALPDANIARGMDWLSKNFNSTFDLNHEHGNQHTEVYSLFGLSRVGAASGYKYLGNVDWYQRSTDYLCQNQQPDGSWTAFFSPVAATSMGIMSLAYGRASVVLNKLQYTAPVDPAEAARNKQSIAESVWNLRPKDLFNFTIWMGTDLEDRFNFQVVNLATSSQDDLHDAPILYICGNRGLDFSAKEQSRLRQFVNEGGLILGNADCDSQAFSAAFEQLGKQLFPQYQFRTLPPEHPIFANEQKRTGLEAKKIAVRGISNGVRELMLLPQADLSAMFEGRLDKAHPEIFRLAEDIILYAGDNSRPPQKGITYIVRSNPNALVNKQLSVARLQYAGNWNPEPGGWQRLAALMHNQDKIDLSVTAVKLDKGKLVIPAPATRPSDDEIRKTAVAQISPAEIQATGGDPVKFDDLVKSKVIAIHKSFEISTKRFDVAHLTGTASFQFTPAQRDELRQFADAGGIIFIDAAGGSTEFADSAEAELKIIFGAEADQLASPLRHDNPIFTAGPAKIDSFQYHRFAQTKLGLSHAPRLRGITRNGRLVVILSEEDISQGLVGNRVDGIIGYEPQTATEIVQSIMLYAAH